MMRNNNDDAYGDGGDDKNKNGVNMLRKSKRYGTSTTSSSNATSKKKNASKKKASTNNSITSHSSTSSKNHGMKGTQVYHHKNKNKNKKQNKKKNKIKNLKENELLLFDLPASIHYDENVNEKKSSDGEKNVSVSNHGEADNLNHLKSFHSNHKHNISKSRNNDTLLTPHSTPTTTQPTTRDKHHRNTLQNINSRSSYLSSDSSSYTNNNDAFDSNSDSNSDSDSDSKSFSDVDSDSNSISDSNSRNFSSNDSTSSTTPPVGSMSISIDNDSHGYNDSSSSTSSNQNSQAIEEEWGDDYDDDEDDDNSVHSQNHKHSTSLPKSKTTKGIIPTVEPYITRLERFELFSTAQAYYLVGSDKAGVTFRVLKMDRTLIERDVLLNNNDNNNTNSNAKKSWNTNHHQDTAHSKTSTNFNLQQQSNPHSKDTNINKNANASTNKFKPTIGQEPHEYVGLDLDNHNHPNANTANNNDNTSESNQYDKNANPRSPKHLSNHLHQQQPQHQSQPQHTSYTPTTTNHTAENFSTSEADDHHQLKPTLRPLKEFCVEDPTVYTADEITEMLDMIHDGNQTNQTHRNRMALHYYNNRQEHPENNKNADTKKRAMNHASSAEPQNYNQQPNHSVTGSSGSGGGGGGLKPLVKAYGIVGFVRFLDCYYLTLITKKSKVGSIGGNDVYSIRGTETFPLKPAERLSGGVFDQGGALGTKDGGGMGGVVNDPSSVLINMWNRGKRSLNLGFTNRELAELRYQSLYQVLDLAKDFFFSYTYDITRSLQDNVLAMTSKTFPPPPFKDMYCWNHFLTREFQEDVASTLTSFNWVLPIIHGAFVQKKLNDYGRSINLVLLARRSRHFAGTRYLKRGVSDRGKVANDVEHEQIVHDETTSFVRDQCGAFSSFLQVRGSIPTFWTQESSVTMPKPPIVLSRVDPSYHATQLHFADLLHRYGSPIIVADLVKQSEKREREVIVGNEYRHAIDYLNSHIDEKHKIRYCALDYSHVSKHRGHNISSALHDVATWAVNQTGFFCTSPRWKIVENEQVEPFDSKNTNSFGYDGERGIVLTNHLGVPVFPMEQKGVLRTNCIDCLDRTNVAQFSAGVQALGQQLVVMGIRSSAKLDPSSIIVKLLIDMYVDIGDHISMQYGGSEAHKKVASSGATSNINGPVGKHKELLTSIRRYYSNAFTDRLKQDAMNLFLGYYIPSRHSIPLWEIESDYYLHNFHVQSGRGSMQAMRFYQRNFAVDWSDDDEENLEDSSNVKKILRKKSIHSRNEADKNSEPWRIARVRKRCKAQNETLSVWWKIAIQSYVQQRAWMQLGKNHAESLLLPYFERIHQPSKLTQFDKIFARNWAAPIRLSHAAQHKVSGIDDTETFLIHRKRNPPRHSDVKRIRQTNPRDVFDGDTRSDDEDEKKSDDDNAASTMLRNLIDTHGKHLETTELSKFVDSYRKRRYQERYRRPSHSQVSDDFMNYIGNNQEISKPCNEFVVYAQKGNVSNPFVPNFKKNVEDEFTKCLHETNLNSNDVCGILKLSQSAHIDSEIKSGPYRGLSQHESAVEVTTVIHEQFNNLDNRKKRGELRGGGLPGVSDALKEREIDTPGVIEAVFGGWDRFSQNEGTYTEIMNTSSICHKRSDLTDKQSLSIYNSFFGYSTPLTNLDVSYIVGSKIVKPHSLVSERQKKKEKSLRTPSGEGMTSTFRSKAKMMGFPVILGKRMNHISKPSLFSRGDEPLVPKGFEQINDDLFARKENKFMVFNGAGLVSWPPQARTKEDSINNDGLFFSKES